MSGYSLRFQLADGSGFYVEPLKAEDDGEAKLLGELRFLMSPEFDHMAVLQNGVTVFTLWREAI